MSTKSNRNQNQTIGGVILLILGVLFLVILFLGGSVSSLLIVPTVGVLLLVWGILARHAGPMIPGGIVTGVGVGLLLAIDDGFATGVFMLSLGLGFVLVTVMTAVFAPTTHWWALIPGGINAVIGLGFFFGGTVWQLLNWWPLILIALGLHTLWRNYSRQEDQTGETS